jgi:hypothetical protein
MAKKRRKRSDPTYPKKSKAEKKKARAKRIEKRDAASERVYQEGERLGREWRSRHNL